MWVKLDDGFAEHPKVWGLTGEAFRLHVAGLCYCARRLTDGRIPPDLHKGLVPRYRPVMLGELTKAGLWREDMDRAHWIHDYLEYNPSAEASTARLEARAEGAVRGNHRRWHLARGVSDPDCPHCQSTDWSSDP